MYQEGLNHCALPQVNKFETLKSRFISILIAIDYGWRWMVATKEGSVIIYVLIATPPKYMILVLVFTM